MNVTIHLNPGIDPDRAATEIQQKLREATGMAVNVRIVRDQTKPLGSYAFDQQ